ncbi:type III secretion system chaperone [Pseudomonas fluorescens]|uniref:Uncharacterized protein n=1 Tax=Pseudomonas fluorescens TaxID=294 RepID=A0A5E7GAQ2_PSEFL|nr:type III secretion system chaperone [Pseudomonas fluorescens]VVO47962.1 hypothetical protein PS880_00147 [Pseudomonas fluorescens]
MKELTLQLFEELIFALNLSPVDSDEEGHCSLVFDNEIIVDIQLIASESRIVFTSMVGLLSETYGNQQLRSLMSLNLAIARELSMSLGLEPETNAVLLTYSVDVQHVSLSTITEALSLFLSQTEKCQSTLQ